MHACPEYQNLCSCDADDVHHEGFFPGCVHVCADDVDDYDEADCPDCGFPWAECACPHLDLRA